MKSAAFAHVVYCTVLVYAGFIVLSEGILQGKRKSSWKIDKLEKKYAYFREKGIHSDRKLSSKESASGGVSRPESITRINQMKEKKRRCGCQVCHHIQSCVGGCMPCCDCHKECDEGCWCPISGKEEPPKKKPEEPCCCPMCCPCCPRPCCHHVHHHHYHCCCPCCHCCCHCCQCCPCCCHCCHCKKSHGLLSSPPLARSFYPCMTPPDTVLHSPFLSLFRMPYLSHGPFRA